MMRWLDPLGWMKWPSILLVVSPVAAYPFWLPDAKPAAYCGEVTIEQHVFRVYKTHSTGQFVLRMNRSGAPLTLSGKSVEPIGFDGGGMIVSGDSRILNRLSCI